MLSGKEQGERQPTLYAAIELSKKSWVISVAHPDRVTLWRYVETGQLPEGVLLDAKIVAA